VVVVVDILAVAGAQVDSEQAPRYLLRLELRML